MNALKYLLTDSLVNVTKPRNHSELSIDSAKNTAVSVQSQNIRKRTQRHDESSDWNNYRFLLLPGSLALLTLIGMQIVVCTFWLPKSVKRYFHCCGSKHNLGCEQNDECNELKEKCDSETSSTSHRNKITTTPVGSNCAYLGRCITADHRYLHQNTVKLATSLNIPQCFSYGPQHLPCTGKSYRCPVANDNVKSYPYRPICSDNNRMIAQLDSMRRDTSMTTYVNSGLFYLTDPENKELIYPSTRAPTTCVPLLHHTHKSPHSGSTHSNEKPTIRFVDPF